MRVQRATIETKSAWIGQGFGRDLAIRWFGEEIVASLPVYSRGKSKGKCKVYLVWDKCIVGGWDNGAGVVRPNAILRIKIHSNRYGCGEDGIFWYKASVTLPPDPCGETRLSDLGRKILRERSDAALDREVSALVQDFAACEASIREDAANGHPASVECVRRMSAR